MLREVLYFTGPQQLSCREELLAPLQPDELRVSSLYSAISAGTELLLYRNQLQDLAIDSDLDPLQSQLNYPTPYGYSTLGRVSAVGSRSLEAWLGKVVFIYSPHGSQHHVRLEQLSPVPDDIPLTRAVLFANAETAVNLVLDAQPLLGERVAVWGLGVVGSLLSCCLSRFPLERLVAFEPFPLRRRLLQSLGPRCESFHPDAAPRENWDLCFELSGQAAAINQAIASCAYSGRIMIGSWMGAKLSPLQLGGAFHRRRLQLISSQVSTIAPQLRGRYDRQRRAILAWDLLRNFPVEQLITARCSLRQASEAFQQLDQHSDQCLQIIFDYAGG